jgi:hypothetical protein
VRHRLPPSPWTAVGAIMPRGDIDVTTERVETLKRLTLQGEAEYTNHPEYPEWDWDTACTSVPSPFMMQMIAEHQGCTAADVAASLADDTAYQFVTLWEAMESERGYDTDASRQAEAEFDECEKWNHERTEEGRVLARIERKHQQARQQRTVRKGLN